MQWRDFNAVRNLAGFLFLKIKLPRRNCLKSGSDIKLTMPSLIADILVAGWNVGELDATNTTV